MQPHKPGDRLPQPSARYNGINKASTKGGYSGSFFGGIFAFLMAISCTGPFLGAALPFAMKLPSSLIMVFFLLNFTA